MLARLIERNWYRSWVYNIWLLPLWPLVALVVYHKRRRFLRQLPEADKVPVVVVGNITVGGTGKTPLITWLVDEARALGLKPGIVSRGYGSRADHYPLILTDTTSAAEGGDEPVMLYQRLGCPVVVDPQRSRAVDELSGRVDIIFSDDGLQHYGMARAAELVVVDAKRKFGNGWLLPVGPLREPVSRLATVDKVLLNGEDFTVEPAAIKNALTAEVVPSERLAGMTVHAVSGIGNPQRFYDTLKALGATVVEHAFPDHHDFSEADFDFARDAEQIVVMTEKDWIKCRAFARSDWWVVTVKAVLNKDVQDELQRLLKTLTQR